ncbi:MAG: serine protease [Bacteroidota bacterium]
MPKTKSQEETLKGILEQFTPELIQAVVGQTMGEEPIVQYTSEVDDPGMETDQETDECLVELDELVDLERIIGPNLNFLPAHFLEEGALLQKAVARIRIPNSGFGTGFLVSPSLLMTNNHVINSRARARVAQAEFNFQTDFNGNPQEVDSYSFSSNGFFYTHAALDFTLLRVNRKCTYVPIFGNSGIGGANGEFLEEGPFQGENGRPSLPLLPRFRRVCHSAGNKWGHIQLPSAYSFARGQHINIIQHPRARRKEVAVQENNLDRIFQNHLRYTTDTEPGSSGSPVFNNRWDLMAIHHSAGERQNGQWVSNQGVRMDRIVRHLRTVLEGSAVGRNVLNELGI